MGGKRELLDHVVCYVVRPHDQHANMASLSCSSISWKVCSVYLP